MAAFDRIDCGIEGLNKAFDNIRLGDNVVWQLDRLDDFRLFAGPFVNKVLEGGHQLHYMRFASHEPLVRERPGVVVHTFDPHTGFEPFTLAVRSVITQYGREAFYVFDCLSELQTAWSADMMMGNFFRLTCPYLFELDTVAYFPVLRSRHSFAAVAKIRDTTQLLIDVFRNEDVAPVPPDVSLPFGLPVAPTPLVDPTASDGESFFVKPLKVWNRYSDTMFLAHRYDVATGEVKVCSNGVDAARFYALMGRVSPGGEGHNIDYWDRFFIDAQRDFRRGALTEETCGKMCDMMMAKDERMRAMVRHYFEPQDYFAVRDRMVGTGLVGGKACGMLLAQKIVATKLPQHAARIEPHDSFYLGTDVFYSYIVANGLWPLRIAQRSPDGFVSEAPALRDGLLGGDFPEDIRDQFRRILEYYGQSPIIVRSSSFLEDGFGNAFAGKYESVFCPNAGDADDRLTTFEDAVRRVYASTMDPSALEYRLRNGLDSREEQMAILVQRVSGSHCGVQAGKNLFMPTAAGVGYSHAAYRFMRDVDPNAGMLRLVMGLGTRAVDRTEGDYPRIVSLDKPLTTPATTLAEKHRYSQHYADVLDLSANAFLECNVQDLIELLPPCGQRAVFEHDRDAERMFYGRGQARSVLFASCEGLCANKEFIGMMSDMLSVLHDAYGGAVDIEFTVNVGDDCSLTVNLLQCRPLSQMAPGEKVEVPRLRAGRTLFDVHGEAMGASRRVEVDALVAVDPQGYYTCPHALKPTVAQQVGDAGAWLEANGFEHALLLAPGRIGTSSAELGVPVSFAQIATFEGICEVAYSKAGYAPELSYGSHMFQDLVEADIYYAALLEDETKASYAPELLEGMPEMTAEVFGAGEGEGEGAPEGGMAAGAGAVASADAVGEAAGIDGIVRVYDLRGRGLTLWHDHVSCESVCGYAESD